MRCPPTLTGPRGPGEPRALCSCVNEEMSGTVTALGAGEQKPGPPTHAQASGRQ